MTTKTTGIHFVRFIEHEYFIINVHTEKTHNVKDEKSTTSDIISDNISDK